MSKHPHPAKKPGCSCSRNTHYQDVPEESYGRIPASIRVEGNPPKQNEGTNDNSADRRGSSSGIFDKNVYVVDHDSVAILILAKLLLHLPPQIWIRVALSMSIGKYQLGIVPHPTCNYTSKVNVITKKESSMESKT